MCDLLKASQGTLRFVCVKPPWDVWTMRAPGLNVHSPWWNRLNAVGNEVSKGAAVQSSSVSSGNRGRGIENWRPAQAEHPPCLLEKLRDPDPGPSVSCCL